VKCKQVGRLLRASFDGAQQSRRSMSALRYVAAFTNTPLSTAFRPFVAAEKR
jgi:hypothetical protein